jgi:NADH:ubiquinone oxidoreductase subunit 2 (subunit N)
MNLNLFAVLLSPLRRGQLQGGAHILGANSLDREHLSIQRVKYTTDLAHLNKTNPVLAFTLAVTLFSMAGIPPLAGFYSKAFLFFAAMSSSMYLLGFVGVLASVVSCFYYIRLIKIMYFEAANSIIAVAPMNEQKQTVFKSMPTLYLLIEWPKLGWFSFYRIARENSLVLGFSFFFILLFITFPSPLYLASHKAALAMTL